MLPFWVQYTRGVPHSPRKCIKDVFWVLILSYELSEVAKKFPSAKKLKGTHVFLTEIQILGKFWTHKYNNSTNAANKQLREIF